MKVRALTQRGKFQSEKDEEEGEEEENIQRQRVDQPEVQQVDPCGSSTAIRFVMKVISVCKAVQL